MWKDKRASGGPEARLASRVPSLCVERCELACERGFALARDGDFRGALAAFEARRESSRRCYS